MTFNTFAAHVAATEPTVTRSFTPLDGYEYSANRTTVERHDDAFPYAFGVIPNNPATARERVFAEYCEGDVTRYEFATKDDRDEAVKLYTQTAVEAAQEIIESRRYSGEYADTGALAAAIIEWISDYYSGAEAQEPTEDRVTEALDKYRGAFENDAAYVEEMTEGFMDAPDDATTKERAGIPAWVTIRIDWEDTARTLDSEGAFFSFGGHYFEAAE